MAATTSGRSGADAEEGAAARRLLAPLTAAAAAAPRAPAASSALCAAVCAALRQCATEELGELERTAFLCELLPLLSSDAGHAMLEACGEQLIEAAAGLVRLEYAARSYASNILNMVARHAAPPRCVRVLLDVLAGCQGLFTACYLVDMLSDVLEHVDYESSLHRQMLDTACVLVMRTLTYEFTETIVAEELAADETLDNEPSHAVFVPAVLELVRGMIQRFEAARPRMSASAAEGDRRAFLGFLLVLLGAPCFFSVKDVMPYVGDICVLVRSLRYTYADLLKLPMDFARADAQKYTRAVSLDELSPHGLSAIHFLCRMVPDFAGELPAELREGAALLESMPAALFLMRSASKETRRMAVDMASSLLDSLAALDLLNDSELRDYALDALFHELSVCFVEAEATSSPTLSAARAHARASAGSQDEPGRPERPPSERSRDTDHSYRVLCTVCQEKILDACCAKSRMGLLLALAQHAPLDALQFGLRRARDELTLFGFASSDLDTDAIDPLSALALLRVAVERVRGEHGTERAAEPGMAAVLRAVVDFAAFLSRFDASNQSGILDAPDVVRAVEEQDRALMLHAQQPASSQ